MGLSGRVSAETVFTKSPGPRPRKSISLPAHFEIRHSSAILPSTSLLIEHPLPLVCSVWFLFFFGITSLLRAGRRYELALPLSSDHYHYQHSQPYICTNLFSSLLPCPDFLRATVECFNFRILCQCNKQDAGLCENHGRTCLCPTGSLTLSQTC